MNNYDYIIIGAGASGLMLAYRMANDAFFDDKSILIIDQEKDKGNDRTWCFWDKPNGEWDSLSTRSWKKIYFGSPEYSEILNIEPYRYNMIRSASFYNALWHTIEKKDNIVFKNETFESLRDNRAFVTVVTSNKIYKAKKVFSSVLIDRTFELQDKYPVLKQHFVGWFIKTKESVFDDEVATFMDFNIPQNNNTRFMYVLPLSKNEALVEYTLFSESLLKEKEYELELKAYLKNSSIKSYDIIEKEHGSIPMTSYKFFNANTNNVMFIGTAGGWTKASTGYTFMSTTQKTKELVKFLKKNKSFKKFSKRNKFWFYDLLLLDVLANDNANGSKLFSSLFKKTKTETIFKFLDEKSNFYEDLKIITGVPPFKFVIAVAKRLFFMR
ncbi:MAG: lycopene cyclase [Winogradskyella sp.]|nr:lycopene cyclase [Winogradskyella sp.]